MSEAITSKLRTITLTDRPPVRIREDLWPMIAQGDGDSFAEQDPGRHGQASQRGELTEWTLRVRQHQDGRAIVYGVVTTPAWDRTAHDWRGGEILDPESHPEGVSSLALVAAIRRVGRQAAIPDHVIRECIAALPPVVL